MSKIEKKQWKELLEWLASLHPSVRLLFLRLIVSDIDDENQSLELKELLRDAEDELATSPEWKKFGSPLPEGIDITTLFPTLAGKPEESLEQKLKTVTPEGLKELAKDIGIDIYKPKFEAPYRLPSKEYGVRASEAKAGVSELYLLTKEAYEQKENLSKSELQQRVEEIQERFGPHITEFSRFTAKEEAKKLIASERMIESMKNTAAYETRKSKEARERNLYQTES